MKIYTRTGDDGRTDLADGRRVAKNAAEVELSGTLDELNSLLGLVRAACPPEPVDAVVSRIQSELFLLGAEVTGASRGCRAADTITEDHVLQLEAEIDRFDAELPPLRAFILPGGTRPAAVLHLARAVCRRAERRLVSLTNLPQQEPEAIRPVVGVYLNRLSDLLFVLARSANAQSAAAERTWPQRPQRE
ncbi:MAG TPA: cob(I)yrinic acid a,c-diamide adenosyltransferase [Thermoguttaceae bacterium]|nr:cob(I)yrinic acid a,c-diamide adenosyltransferase [Thermoguttaceae bacterium]